MQRVSGRRCHVFLTIPIGVFGRGLDSALNHACPRAPEIWCLAQAGFWRGARLVGIICDMGGTSKFEILSGFPEHSVLTNTCAIALLASPGVIPRVFNAGVNPRYASC